MNVLRLNSSNAFLLKHVVENSVDSKQTILLSLMHKYILYTFHGNTKNDDYHMDIYTSQCPRANAKMRFYKGRPIAIDPDNYHTYYSCTNSFIREYFHYLYGLHWFPEDKEKCLKRIKENFPNQYQKTIEMESKIQNMDPDALELIIQQNVIDARKLGL
jgi:hypothetical protein